MRYNLYRHDFCGAAYSEPLAPLWIGRRCRFCGHISGLDDWQIVSMPIVMSICEKSTIRIPLWKRIFDSCNINCLGE